MKIAVCRGLRKLVTRNRLEVDLSNLESRKAAELRNGRAGYIREKTETFNFRDVQKSSIRVLGNDSVFRRYLEKYEGWWRQTW